MTLLTTQTRDIRNAFDGHATRVMVQPVAGLEKIAARQGWVIADKEASTGYCIVIKGCKPHA